MEITKRGLLPEERKWKGVCAYCGSEAKASEHEMGYIDYDSQRNTQFSWVKCPVCNRGGNRGGMLFYPAKV